MTNKNNINEVEVYKAYIKAKDTTGYSLRSFCKRLGISTTKLYAVVKRMEEGDEIQLDRCLNKNKYDCIWTYRYARRFNLILELEKDKVAKPLGKLIREMHRDGFGVRDIARRVGRDPSTVMYHLNIRN
jgi:hypothetical protein